MLAAAPLPRLVRARCDSSGPSKGSKAAKDIPSCPHGAAVHGTHTKVCLGAPAQVCISYDNLLILLVQKSGT